MTVHTGMNIEKTVFYNILGVLLNSVTAVMTSLKMTRQIM